MPDASLCPLLLLPLIARKPRHNEHEQAAGTPFSVVAVVGVTGLVIRGPDVVYFSVGPSFLSPIRVGKCAGEEAWRRRRGSWISWSLKKKMLQDHRKTVR
ncbi:hypothetical protein MUK42_37411, partial [Musa troglodytarum]